MMDEILLHNKINTLQSEMLKLHKKLSPTKSQESERGTPLYTEVDNKFASTCVEICFGFLKICACIVGPATFPTIIFCIEGSSRLFWQVTAISCVITLILALMTATVVYTNMKKFKRRIDDTFASLRCVFNDLGIFRFIGEVMASDFLKKNAHNILYLTFLLFACFLSSFISYVKNLSTIFYASLVSTGFVCGILSSAIYGLLNSPELLPVYSPCKIKMHVTAPSPEVKRKLKFTLSKTREQSPEFRFSDARSVCVPGETVQSTETQNTPMFFSRLPSSACQEMGPAQTLQLPTSFSSFFRRLSF